MRLTKSHGAALAVILFALPAFIFILPAAAPAYSASTLQTSTVAQTMTWNPQKWAFASPSTAVFYPNGTATELVNGQPLLFNFALSAATYPTSLQYNSTYVSYAYTLAHSCQVNVSYKQESSNIKQSFDSPSCAHIGTYPFSFFSKKGAEPIAENSTNGLYSATLTGPRYFSNIAGVCQLYFSGAYYSWCGDKSSGATVQYVIVGGTPTLELVTTAANWSIDPSTIGSSTASDATSNGYDGQVCVASGLLWVFYNDGTSEGIRRSSDGGATWGVEATITTSGRVGDSFSFFCSGTTLYYATSTTTAFYYRYGPMNSDGSIPWTISESTNAVSDITPGVTTVTLDSSGNLFVGVAAGTGHVDVWKCATPSSCTWSESLANSAFASAFATNIKLTALTSGRLSLVGTDDPDKLFGATFDGTTWSSVVSTGTSYYMRRGSCVAIADTTECATTDNTNVYYLALSYNANSPAWSSPATIGGGIYATISGDGSSQLAIGYVASSTTVDYSSSSNSGASWSVGASVSSSETSAAYPTAAFAISSNDLNFAWTSGSGPNYNVRFASVSLTITQPVKITMSVGVSGTWTVSGCSVSPTTIASDGTAHNLVANPSCLITITRPADASGIAYRLGGAMTNTSFTQTTPASGTGTERDVTAYELLQQTFKITANAQTNFDAGVTTNFKGTQLGVAATTICASAPNSNASSTCSTGTNKGYADYNTAVSCDSTMGSAPVNSQWKVGGTSSFTQSTAQNTDTCAYYKQFTNQFAYSVTGGGTPTAPTLTYTSLGTAGTTTALTTVLTGIYIDSGSTCTVTNPTTGSTSTERWDTGTACPTASSGGGSTTFAYYHQYTCTCSYSGSVVSAPSFSRVYLGSVTATALTTSATTLWADNSGAYTNVNPTANYVSATERYQRNVANGTVGSAFTLVVAMYHQYSNTYAFTVLGGGSPNMASVVSYAQFGGALSLTPTTVGVAAWTDAATSSTYPATVAGASGERWTTPTTSFTVNSATTENPSYYHQYDSNNPSGLSFTFNDKGSSATSSAATFWADVATCATLNGVKSSCWTLAFANGYFYEASNGLEAYMNATATAGSLPTWNAGSAQLTFGAVKIHAKVYNPPSLSLVPATPTVTDNGVSVASTYSGNIIDFSGSSSFIVFFTVSSGSGTSNQGSGSSGSTICSFGQVVDPVTLKCVNPPTTTTSSSTTTTTAAAGGGRPPSGFVYEYGTLITSLAIISSLGVFIVIGTDKTQKSRATRANTSLKSTMKPPSTKSLLKSLGLGGRSSTKRVFQSSSKKAARSLKRLMGD